MILPTGIDCIDAVLGGGLETGRVTHVYGEAASGKTTLALVCIDAVYKMGYGVIMINAEANSPIERLEQITGQPFSKLDGLVKLLIPKNFDEQTGLIEDLDMFVQKNTRLIVVDTLTRLYRVGLESKERNYEAHRELNRQAGLLKGVAKYHDIAVLILNQVRAPIGKDGSDFEPVAGNIMEYWADVTLKMRIEKQRGERVVERIGRLSRECGLVLTNRGFSSTMQHKKQ